MLTSLSKIPFLNSIKMRGHHLRWNLWLGWQCVIAMGRLTKRGVLSVYRIMADTIGFMNWKSELDTLYGVGNSDRSD